MIYYVSAEAAAKGDGSRKKPFQKIQQAADAAAPGDEVVVLPGVYREAVNPPRAGRPDARITYRAYEKGTAVITGAERIRTWEKAGGDVWRAEIPNSLFPGRNPFATPVSGDWFIIHYPAHLGDVFLDGKSLYEVTSLDGVREPVKSAESWDPEFSLYVWYAEQDAEQDATVVFANFRGLDPNEENVEISVRKTCFYPEAEGVGYITLSGFVIRQAATQWAPPTAYQEGMVGPHWSKGWIIEDCEISESKCVGISLGKYYQPEDDNRWGCLKYKDGAQTQRDIVLSALREGWTKERIGSHIVRRCDIHDCGQAGIAGFMGCAFSVIEDCHIHHINNKQNLAGAEIAGIKLHAAIDVVLRRCHIHHSTRGLWLDWMAQGTRVTGCLFHDNTLPWPHLMHGGTERAYGEDIWIEVTHGPTLVDHCLLLSTRSVRLSAQGTAFVHNLFGGSLCAVGRGTENGAPTLNSVRYTPYHLPHSTEVAGFMTILHGDVRFYNNIFVQQAFDPFLVTYVEKYRDFQWDDGNLTAGTWPFDGYPDREEWERQFEGYCGEGGVRTDRYYSHLPVYCGGNAYYNGARPWEKEREPYTDSASRVELKLEEEDGKWLLRTNLGGLLPGPAEPVDTELLGEAFEPEQKYENPDGSPIVFDTDYFGLSSGDRPLMGPFSDWGDGPLSLTTTLT